jgi:hypothetical protein
MDPVVADDTNLTGGAGTATVTTSVAGGSAGGGMLLDPDDPPWCYPGNPRDLKFLEVASGAKLGVLYFR